MGGNRLLTFLAGVALVVALPGCGDEETRGQGVQPAHLTERQYVQRADAICARYRQRISDRLRATVEGLRTGGPLEKAEAEAAVEDVILPEARSQYEELRRLPPPRGDEDFLDLMLFKFSLSLENGEEDLARLFRVKPSAYTEFGEGSLMTEEYEVSGCGSTEKSATAMVRDYASP